MKNIEKRRSAAKWILLLLLVYCLVITVLCRLLPDNRTVALLCPFTLVAVYLEQWATDSAAIVVISHTLVWLFAVLPLLGWIMLCKPLRAGKPLIVAPYCLLLAFNFVITASHFISGLGMRSAEYVHLTLLLCAVSLVISVAVLLAVCIWQPKRS